MLNPSDQFAQITPVQIIRKIILGPTPSRESSKIESSLVIHLVVSIDMVSSDPYLWVLAGLCTSCFVVLRLHLEVRGQSSVAAPNN